MRIQGHRGLLRRAISASVLVPLAALGLAACSDDGEPSADDGTVTVVASFYPLAWAAEAVGGSDVKVSDLTPAGGEPHDLELTPEQVQRLVTADVVVAMGRGFQPAVEAAAADRDAATLLVLDALGVGADGETVAAHEHDDEHSEHAEDEHAADEHAADEHADEEGLDPHVWLDPDRMIAVVDEIEAVLSDAVPDAAARFATNADAVRAELAALDTEMSTGLAECERRTIFASHDAFGWLAARYDLEQEGIAGLSPDQEPSPDRLAELTELVDETGATTIFSETLVSPEIAETLAAEAGGLVVATLNPIEGRTQDEIDAGTEYPDLMRANLAALREGLACA